MAPIVDTAWGTCDYITCRYHNTRFSPTGKVLVRKKAVRLVWAGAVAKKEKKREEAENEIEEERCVSEMILKKKFYPT